jgi:uncharacterized membrane protein
MWFVLHGHLTIIEVFQSFSIAGLNLILSPLSYTRNYSLLLVIQTLEIGGSVFPLYYIFNIQIKNEKAAVILALSYLIFFPLSGPNFYDFHYQTFFMLFFLTGYALFLHGNFKTSMVFFILAGLAEWRYFILILIYSFTELLISLKYKNHAKDNKKLYFSIVLLLVSSVLFLTAYESSQGYIGGVATLGVAPSLYSGLSFNLTNKLVTILIIMSPLLFLPLFSARWLPLMLPFFILVLMETNPSFAFPTILHGQYFSMIIPFLYLGMGDSLSHMQTRLQKENEFKKVNIFWNNSFNQKINKKKTHISMNKKNKAIPFVILATILMFAIVFQPYSPVNNDMTFGFNSFFGATPYSDPNLTNYVYFQSIVKLIPPENSSVLIQANLPQVLPRAPIFGNFTTGFVLPVTGQENLIWGNISLADVINNHYPGYIIYKGKFIWTNVSLDWAIADLNSPWFLNGQVSMYEFTKLMLQSQKYGIVAEANGIILIERNYYGPVKLFQGSTVVYGTNSKTSPYYDTSKDVIYTENMTNQTQIANFEIGTILPGYYVFKINMLASNFSQGNWMNVIIGNEKNILLQTKTLNGTNIHTIKRSFYFDIPLYSNQVFSNIFLQIFIVKWVGLLQISNIALSLIQPTNNNYSKICYPLGGTLPPNGTLALANSTLNDSSPFFAIDGNITNQWISPSTDAYLELKFPSAINISGLSILADANPSEFETFTIYYFLNNSWQKILSNETFIAIESVFHVNFFTIHTTAIKISIQTEKSWIGIEELTLS